MARACTGLTMVIFVSHPYSAETLGQVYENVRRAMEIGGELVARGHVPIIPHLFYFWENHLLAARGETYSYEGWMRLTLALVERAEALYCERESPGVRWEIARAHSLGLPIYLGLEEIPVVESSD